MDPDGALWPWHESVCRKVYDCLSQVYPPEDAQHLALSVSPHFRSIDYRRNGEEVWRLLLDAAVAAQRERELLTKVLEDGRKAVCHRPVEEWFRWRAEADEVGPRSGVQSRRGAVRGHLSAVPDLSDPQDPSSRRTGADEPAALKAAVGRLRGQVAMLGATPTPGLLALLLPEVRRLLREIDGLLTDWRQATAAARLEFRVRVEGLSRIARLRDRCSAADAAAADLSGGVPAADALSRLVRAVDALADQAPGPAAGRSQPPSRS